MHLRAHTHMKSISRRKLLSSIVVLAPVILTLSPRAARAQGSWNRSESKPNHGFQVDGENRMFHTWDERQVDMQTDRNQSSYPHLPRKD